MKDTLIFFGALFGFMTCVAALAVWITALSGSITCEAKASAMHMRYSYGIAQGCMIEHKPGQWVPLSAFRVVP